MRRFCIPIMVVLFVGAESPVRGNQPLTEWQALGAYPYGGRPKLIAKMTSEKRQELIAAIKNAGMEEDLRKQYDDLLVQLGDEETIQKQVNLVLHGDFREWLAALELVETVRDPKIIAALAPALFENLDTSDRPHLVQESMLSMICETPEFTGELQQWAGKTIVNAMPYYNTLLLRDWWKANEAHFKAGNYLAVRPVEPSPATSAWYDRFLADLIRQAAQPAAPPTPVHVTPVPSAPPSPPPIVPPAAAKDAENIPDHRPRFRWMIMVAAVLLLSAFAWRFTCRKN